MGAGWSLPARKHSRETANARVTNFSHDGCELPLLTSRDSIDAPTERAAGGPSLRSGQRDTSIGYDRRGCCRNAETCAGLYRDVRLNLFAWVGVRRDGDKYRIRLARDDGRGIHRRVSRGTPPQPVWWSPLKLPRRFPLQPPFNRCIKRVGRSACRAPKPVWGSLE